MDRSAEHALVRRAKAGDGRAVEALIRGHQDALYAFVLRMSGRPEVAEDVVGEALVRVLGNIDRFDSRFRFSTWLFTIARRLYLNSRQKLAPASDSPAVEVRAARGPGPGRRAAETETMNNARRLIDHLMDALPGQQREVVLLYHQQGWPIAEIAEHLGMPVGTVKSHLHRARKRMRRVIEASPVMRRRAEEVWT